MNLAQLIDPERVQRGFEASPLSPFAIPSPQPLAERKPEPPAEKPKAIEAAPPAPKRPKGAVGLVRKVLEALAGAPEGLKFAELCERLDVALHARDTVRVTLQELERRNEIGHQGKRGQFVYEITLKGRARIA